jgi:hypothetical protein
MQRIHAAVRWHMVQSWDKRVMVDKAASTESKQAGIVYKSQLLPLYLKRL